MLKKYAVTLSARLGYRFVVYNPFEDFVAIKTAGLRHLAGRGPSLCVLLGAALDRGATINLLPERSRYSFKRFAKRFSTLSAITAYLLLVFAVNVVGANHLKQMQGKIEEMESFAAMKTAEERAALILEARIRQVEELLKVEENRLRQYASLHNSYPDWRKIYGEIGGLLPANMALDNLTASFDNNRISSPEQKPASVRIVLEGKVRGRSDIQLRSLRNFMSKMRNSSLLRDTTLVSTGLDDVASEKGSILRFTASTLLKSAK